MQRSLPLVLRALAALFLGAALTYWALHGAHRGWNMDRVPVEKTDEITGIAYVEYEERFVPGIEFLGTSVAVSAFLFGASFLFRRRHSKLKPQS
jgi:hypothetical protein